MKQLFWRIARPILRTISTGAIMSIVPSVLPAAVILMEGEREEYSPSITKKTSFADHLLWQLHLHALSDQEMEIGEYIIGNINKDGYLLLTPDEVAADLGVETTARRGGAQKNSAV